MEQNIEVENSTTVSSLKATDGDCGRDMQSNGTGINNCSIKNETEHKETPESEEIPPDDYFKIKDTHRSDTAGQSDGGVNGKSKKLRDSAKSSRHSRTPEFDFETRFVVLNFLGLVPINNSSLNASGTSSSEGNAASALISQTSLESSEKSGGHRHLRSDSGDGSALPTLPLMSISEKFRDNIDLQSKIGTSPNGDSQHVYAGRKLHRRSNISKPEPNPLKSISDSQIGRGWERKVHVEVEVDDNDDVSTTQLGHSLSQLSDGLEQERKKLNVTSDTDHTVVMRRRNTQVVVDGVKPGVNNEQTVVRNSLSSAIIDVHAQSRRRLSNRSSGEQSNFFKAQRSAGSEPPLLLDRQMLSVDGLDDVDALACMEDDDDTAPYNDALLRNNNVHAKPKRPTSIGLKKDQCFSPSTPPSNDQDLDTPPQPSDTLTPPFANIKKSPGDWKSRTPLRKSQTMDSNRSSSYSRPDYSLQFSCQSESSSFSEPNSSLFSTHSSLHSMHINVTSMDVGAVTPLVESKMLPSSVLDLKQELDIGIQELEHDLPGVRGLSPESQIVAYLAHIGDKVQMRHGHLLDRTFNNLTSKPRDQVEYEEYSTEVEAMTEGVSGLTKVTMLLLLGKRIAYSFYNRGEGGIRDVVRYTTKAIEDQAADFIIEKGGWNSIKDLNEEDEDWSANMNVYDVQQAVTPDSADASETHYYSDVANDVNVSADVNISVTSTLGTTSMNTSTHSDHTDTTLVGVTGTEPSLETLASLVANNNAGTQSQTIAIPFGEYASSKNSLNSDGTPRSRHGSGNEVRRGSFNFIPHKGHLLSQNSVSSDGNVVRDDTESTNNVVAAANNTATDTYDPQGSSDVFDSIATNNDVTAVRSVSFECDNNDANNDASWFDANHSRVEGTLDPTLDLEITRDAMLLRQLSMELTREHDEAVERRHYTDTLTVVVAILAVCAIGAIYMWRHK